MDTKSQVAGEVFHRPENYSGGVAAA